MTHRWSHYDQWSATTDVIAYCQVNCTSVVGHPHLRLNNLKQGQGFRIWLVS